MKVTYYDHFGLDEADVSGGHPNWFTNFVIENLQGFQQWFILQRWDRLNAPAQPKPFITLMEFEVPFSGVIN